MLQEEDRIISWASLLQDSSHFVNLDYITRLHFSNILFVFFSGMFQQEWIIKWNQLINTSFSLQPSKIKWKNKKTIFWEKVKHGNSLKSYEYIFSNKHHNIPLRALKFSLRLPKLILEWRNWWAFMHPSLFSGWPIEKNRINTVRTT